MKAPEKVYIDDFGSELSYDWHTEHCYEKDIEYVRKDVFIEEVCKYLQKEVVEDYAGVVWEGLIEDIKKYMEDKL